MKWLVPMQQIKPNTTQKTEQLDTVRDDATNEALTTNQGVKIADNQKNSLRADIGK